MKKLLLATILAASATTASAGIAALADGVTLITDTSIDLNEADGNFNNSFEFIQWWDDLGTAATADSISGFNPTTASSYVLQGIGEVNMFAPSANATGKLSCNGCELTFAFGGLAVDIVQIPNPSLVLALTNFLGRAPTEAELIDNATTFQPAFVPGPVIDTSTAFLNVYFDSTPDLDFGAVFNDSLVDATEMANATNDDLWLSLGFRESLFTPSNLFDGAFGLSKADSFFTFDVTGGNAVKNFDTNKIRFESIGFDVFRDIIGLGLSATFPGNATAGYGLYATGTSGNLTGIAVSAPSTIAFMGLGLFGLAFAARRRNK